MNILLSQTTNPAEAGSEGMFDIRRLKRNDAVADSIEIEFSPCREQPQAARAENAQPPLTIQSAVKAHVVMGSQGARTPEQPELLAALYSRGDQNRVSGHVGFESACPGRQPMRTVAQQQGNQISQQRRHGVSPRLSLDELCPEKGASIEREID